MTYQHQKDINGCGVACLANLLDKPYDIVKKDFEKKFYTIDKGIKVFDMKRYLNGLGLNYELKFFNQKNFNKDDADKYSKIINSITLIAKSEKYPVGHYLLRTKNGWVDPWHNLPSIDNVQASIRKTLPTNTWYVIYPISNKIGIGYATKAEIKAINKGRKEIDSGKFYTLEQVMTECLA